MYIYGNQLHVEADNFTGIKEFLDSHRDVLANVELFKPYGYNFSTLEPLHQFISLSEVGFDKCSIQDCDSLNQIVGLQSIGFFECNFGKQLRLPGPFPNLTKLSIGYPIEVGSDLINDTAKFKSLENLDLYLSRDLSASEFEKIADLHSLKRLQLSGSRQLPLDFIAKLKNLEYLFLDGLGASAMDSSFASILALPNLTSLHLSGAELRMEMDLSNLGSLTHFSIAPHSDNNLEVLITWESLNKPTEA